MARIPFPPDFKDFLKLLNEAQAKYLVIGGWAVVSHGYVRLTGDFDVWIPMDLVNSQLLRQVFQQFIGTAPTIKEMMTPKKIFRVGIEPNRLEVTNHIDGVDFEDCHPSRLMKNFDGVDAPVISLQDLLKNKRASGRFKDLNDVEYLEKMHIKPKRGKKP